MSIIVPNIALTPEEPKEKAVAAALTRLRLSQKDVEKAYIVKTSVDARKKDHVMLVYSVGIVVPNEQGVLDRAPSSGATRKQENTPVFARGEAPLSAPPVIVGFGPAGMFAALALARMGYRPVVLERGAEVEKRVSEVEGFWRGARLNPNTNVQFGEGGAGTFSDGKLTTRIGDERCDYVLRELYAHGAPADILEKAKPHIGTDRLRVVVKAIRQEIISLGGQVLFEHKVESIAIANGRVRSVTVNGAEQPAEALILCIGHSARDTVEMLSTKGLTIEPKAFSVGVRIEHLQSEIDRALYGRYASHPALPSGEYQLSHRKEGRGVYTFCMCPGGTVVPSSSEEGGVVTNGMSEYARDGLNANAALVVGVEPSDFGGGPLGGIAFQRRLEQAAFAAGGASYKAPAQTAGRFLAGKAGVQAGRIAATYALGIVDADFHTLLPPFVSQMLRLGLESFERKLGGFAASDALMTGVETRTSSPVRLTRGETLEAIGVEGLYPCGEGAGYAGGIVSAAVDGVRIAQALMRRSGPPR